MVIFICLNKVKRSGFGSQFLGLVIQDLGEICITSGGWVGY